MFCPRCGNQPANDRVRFCPNCGFRLDGVAGLLLREGVPTNPLNAPQTVEPSHRKRGMRRGAIITFFGIVMFLPIIAFSIAVDSPGPLVLPMTVFLTGIFWMLYYRLFGDESAPAPKQTRTINPPTSQHSYLPPLQSVPMYKSPVETHEPHSVAEHTTRSLGKE
jgi:hypothetical protein